MMAAAGWRARFIAWATGLRRDVLTLWMALRDPRTPRLARVLAWLAVAYALSPIDLIPDFIPVLGYLDDMLLLPLLVWLALRRIPPEVRAECRDRAQEWLARAGRKPVIRWGVVLVVLLWLALGAAIWLAVAAAYP